MERIRDELVRIFMSPQRARGWDCSMPAVFALRDFPEIRGDERLQPAAAVSPPKAMYFSSTRLMLKLLSSTASLPLVLSSSFTISTKPPTSEVDETGRIRFNGHDRIGAEMTEEIMKRLRLHERKSTPTVEAVRQHMVFKDVPRMRIAKLETLHGASHFRR